MGFWTLEHPIDFLVNDKKPLFLPIELEKDPQLILQ